MQMFEPWIQDRQLEYVKHERLVVDILKHVQKNTVGKLINEDGRPNVPSIKRSLSSGYNLLSFS